MPADVDQEPRLPSLPDPFPERRSVQGDPASPEEPKRSWSGRGCLIATGAGCGLLVLLAAIGVAVMVSQVDRLLEFAFDVMATQIEAELLEDVPPAEVERLKEAFDSVREHYASGGATAADNRRLKQALMDTTDRIERGLFDRDDLRRLAERLERIATPEPDG